MTYEVLPGQICITCNFLDFATNFGCHGAITAKEAMLDIVVIMINQSDVLNAQCGSNFSAGIYQLVVHDVDDRGTLHSVPAFVYNNISIMGLG